MLSWGCAFAVYCPCRIFCQHRYKAASRFRTFAFRLLCVLVVLRAWSITVRNSHVHKFIRTNNLTCEEGGSRKNITRMSYLMSRTVIRELLYGVCTALSCCSCASKSWLFATAESRTFPIAAGLQCTAFRNDTA